MELKLQKGWMVDIMEEDNGWCLNETTCSLVQEKLNSKQPLCMSNKQSFLMRKRKGLGQQRNRIGKMDAV